jgi:hypothetical protein
MSGKDNTQIFDYGKSASGNSDQTEHFKVSKSNDTSDRTMIVNVGKDSNTIGTTKRKLFGWLVSFTIDPAGTDFRIFEGKNKFGRDTSNDIRIFQDPKISAEHATLLVRDNELSIRDEMASNTSLLNGVAIGPGQTVQVKDGDVVKFGDNEFIFRKACV